MIMRVTDAGLVLPKSLLEDLDEVEVYRNGKIITIVPHADTSIQEIAATEPLAGLIDFDEAGEVSPDDPFFYFGTDPITDDTVTDASVNLDKYIYTGV